MKADAGHDVRPGAFTSGDAAKPIAAGRPGGTWAIVLSTRFAGVRGRWQRPSLAAIATAGLALFALEAAAVLPTALGHTGTVGLDFALYRDRASSWLAGDGLYLPRQLAGPYTVQPGDALYPPPVLLLLLPFLALPAWLWWAVPGLAVALALARRPPTLGGWAALSLALAWPKTGMALLYGNPAIWALAGVAAGSVWGWPAVLAAVKPVLAPFALVGARSRSFWMAALAGLAACAVFAPMWPDYARVLFGARSPDPFYLLGDLVPAAALWWALSRRRAWRAGGWRAWRRGGGG